MIHPLHEAMLQWSIGNVSYFFFKGAGSKKKKENRNLPRKKAICFASSVLLFIRSRGHNDILYIYYVCIQERGQKGCTDTGKGANEIGKIKNINIVQRKRETGARLPFEVSTRISRSHILAHTNDIQMATTMSMTKHCEINWIEDMECRILYIELVQVSDLSITIFHPNSVVIVHIFRWFILYAINDFLRLFAICTRAETYFARIWTIRAKSNGTNYE